MTATTFGWLCTLGVLAHNAEEALCLPSWSQSAGHWNVAVGANEFRFAVGIQSLTLLGIASAASLTKAAGPALYLWAGDALAMGVNTFVPHLVASVATRSYMPGTASALCPNLPLGCMLIARAPSSAFNSAYSCGRVP